MVLHFLEFSNASITVLLSKHDDYLTKWNDDLSKCDEHLTKCNEYLSKWNEYLFKWNEVLTKWVEKCISLKEVVSRGNKVVIRPHILA